MSDSAAAEADPFPPDNDIRPIVQTGAGGNWSMWAFVALLLVGGISLFSALNASREDGQRPSILLPEGGISDRIVSPDPVEIPRRFIDSDPSEPIIEERSERTPQGREPTLAEQAYIPPPVPPPPPPPPRQDFPVDRPPVAFEPTPNPSFSNSTSAPVQDGSTERITAGRLANPSRTIPQGTVIPAVLETALDSTRAGGVRALVQRDMFGFDGSRVLIPRGSRLYGEYEANLQPGQKRALVQWTRLIRPDGVTIALDSPSSDPLGRAGIRGKVDSKFFQRFGSAILQSVLDIGVGLAVNQASDGVIVALPGSTQNVQITDQQSIQPTLKVKHGTSVSVFVARDLDFSTVDP